MVRLLVALAISVPLLAFAQGYAGLGFGQTTVNGALDCDIAATCDDKDSGFKVLAGYQFSPNFALEGGFIDLGESSFSTPGLFSASADATSLFFHAVGIAPLGERVSLFGKVGLHFWEGEERGQVFGIPFSVSDDGTDLTFGFGLQWNLGKFAARLEWERYDLDEADVSFLGVTGLLRF